MEARGSFRKLISVRQGVWTQQGAKLVGTGLWAAGKDISVSLSAMETPLTCGSAF